MGGFFGAVADRDTVVDVFFGVDYHSHLGTRRAGMASWDENDGFSRSIHSIENTPFRTKFEQDITEMRGRACIGCISDKDPQPIVFFSRHGRYAICMTGCINNAEELAGEFLRNNGHFESHSGGRVNLTELTAALINQRGSIAEGIRYAQERIDGSATIIICEEGGTIVAARDRYGRLPVSIGRSADGYCVSLESFAYQKLGYEDEKYLGPGECVRISAGGIEELSPPLREEKLCAFLWTYFGYPTTHYEGDSVELVRNRGGALLARDDMARGRLPDIDAVCGVPDSGVPYAMGYAYACKKPYMRPFIKYTPTWPRSFMPATAELRHHIAKMKMIPVRDLIKDKKLLFIDDSIVRGTQLQETVDFLYDNGAKQVHMRSACPPIMYSCKYLNFSRSNDAMELIARRVVQELEGDEGQKRLGEYSDGNTGRGRCMRGCIAKKLGFASLEYQSLDTLVESIGIDKSKICTYCWTGKE